jgi:hypothetical protein
MGRSEKRLRQAKLEQYNSILSWTYDITLQWLERRKSSCPPRSSIASDQETKSLSNKRITAGCSYNSTGGSVIKPFRYLARQEGGLGVSLEAMLLLLHVVIPARMLWPHSLRLEVTVVQQQLHLLCGFTPTDEFVLQQLLNHDGMNKLS